MLSVAVTVLVGFSVFGIASVVGAQGPSPRFPDLSKDAMTDAQKRVHDAIAGGPRGGVRGPFGVLPPMRFKKNDADGPLSAAC